MPRSDASYTPARRSKRLQSKASLASDTDTDTGGNVGGSAEPQEDDHLDHPQDELSRRPSPVTDSRNYEIQVIRTPSKTIASTSANSVRTYNITHKHYEHEGFSHEQFTELGANIKATQQIIQRYQEEANGRAKGVLVHLAVHDILLLLLLMVTSLQIAGLMVFVHVVMSPLIRDAAVTMQRNRRDDTACRSTNANILMEKFKKKPY
ncbi:hypothetical protein P153DRAFT_361859 [Dothidotthia symphoricarpi CBS 119687]|uniref:Uncharacterized protein n=1 Tax=Dothidotthia symphoricarpi CBS 119687 TaxID=1392245 RepID=A0A6A5ZVQ7_9PLEO|nr:uncharacterized protein P153DRAFT_361859 [Dothidotthia symphoricarpi CBS 119687]KAF2123619.1 hypothetical protein P153DRAFT_361859 [Dothidotthia symphoricarpi CBS 119687]